MGQKESNGSNLFDERSETSGSHVIAMRCILFIGGGLTGKSKGEGKEQRGRGEIQRGSVD